MKKIAILAFCVLLTACGVDSASTVVPSTPGQALYVALGDYGAALHGARVYAAQPGANIVAVKAIDRIASSEATKATVTYAKVYIRCRKDFSQPGCINFDFSEGALTQNTALLRNIVLSLGAR